MIDIAIVGSIILLICTAFMFSHKHDSYYNNLAQKTRQKNKEIEAKNKRLKI